MQRRVLHQVLQAARLAHDLVAAFLVSDAGGAADCIVSGIQKWDLVICDEAHKMSGHYFGSELKLTKRFKFGQQVAEHCRNFLLMTATPHNGKDEDFHVFLALLDGDRFQGKYRDGVHTADPSDLMRRLVKEDLRSSGTHRRPTGCASCSRI